MRVDIGGVRLFFDVDGAKLVPEDERMREKPTLLLLHGGPGYDHSSFKPLWSEMAGLVQVIYLDHRGNGRSDRDSVANWNLSQWGDDVYGFCQALEIERPIVLGSSFGGTVAMSYATRHPEHPAKLILTNTTARRRPDLILAMFRKLGGPEVEAVARDYIEGPNKETEEAYLRICHRYYSRAELSGKRDFLANTKRTIRNPEVTYYYANDCTLEDGTIVHGEAKRMNLLPDLCKIRCPTLIMGGTNDPITPLEGMRDIFNAIPEGLARLVEFHDCSHSLMLDSPAKYLSTIRTFIQSHGIATT